ncbi:C40 family peptidase [Orrella daihaiensis]|uniref:C40 family peptidase n=1 Tax=Orrella daihaiensis TaxID=2782176 RepID=A0ABY4AKH8_9BURK|nr:C40 family peptidase [Orrella daihaiensis]UOD49567.1 C40 family peptidase [Orrella daihaiensis]
MLTVSLFALAGCASAPDDKSAWLDPQGSRNAKIDIDALDPVTAIAAAQHPLTRQALTHLGIRYRYGGDAPDEGFDCSGLIYYSAQTSLGLRLPRRSADLARIGQKVGRQELAIGDLVFFNTLGRRYSHVGIYLGNELFVHAPSSGGQVRVENMTKRYWAQRYNGARRIDPVLVADRLASQ